MGYLCDGINIGYVTVGISKSFKVNGPCVLPDGTLNLRKVMGIHESGLYPVLGKRV